jgi:major vault protein
VKHLCDRQRSLLKREAKKYTIEEFYGNAADIVRTVALDKSDVASKDKKVLRPAGRFFEENGMLVTDVEVLGVNVEASIAKMMERHQTEMIQKTLDLSDATRKAEMIQKLAEFERAEAELNYKNKMYALELNQKATEEKLKNEAATAAMKRAEEAATTQAKADMQKVFDAIHQAQLARDRAADDQKINTEKQLADIEEAKQKAYAETVAKIYAAISPDLVAALQAQSNASIMNGIGAAVSPIAIAKGESVADAINTLIRGTSLEKTMKNIAEVANNN